MLLLLGLHDERVRPPELPAELWTHPVELLLELLALDLAIPFLSLYLLVRLLVDQVIDEVALSLLLHSLQRGLRLDMPGRRPDRLPGLRLVVDILHAAQDLLLTILDQRRLFAVLLFRGGSIIFLYSLLWK